MSGTNNGRSALFTLDRCHERRLAQCLCAGLLFVLASTSSFVGGDDGEPAPPSNRVQVLPSTSAIDTFSTLNQIPPQNWNYPIASSSITPFAALNLSPPQSHNRAIASSPISVFSVYNDPECCPDPDSPRYEVIHRSKVKILNAKLLSNPSLPPAEICADGSKSTVFRIHTTQLPVDLRLASAPPSSSAATHGTFTAYQTSSQGYID